MIKRLSSYAKLNWFLKVHSKKNNYHKLTTLISLIDLKDEIVIKSNKLKVSKCYFKGEFQSKVQNNTILKLLRLLKIKFPILKDKNFNIYIKKNIPSGSGLGGASSNATAIFNFLVKKYKLNISRKDSLKLLGEVGKDCPVFLNKKTKLVKSFGEDLFELNKKFKFQILLINANIHLSTKDVFNKNNSYSKQVHFSYLKNLDQKKIINTSRTLGNDLIKPALKVKPKLHKIILLIDGLKDKKYYSMTGSGSTFFVVFNNKKALLNAKKIIKKQHGSFWTAAVNTI